MEATLSKVTLSTVVLKDLVTRSFKGSTMIDLIPLSCLMEIKVKDKKLTVRTTDNSNFITTWADVDAEDFSMVVQSKLFMQTISKITTETVTISVEENKVTIQGNGKYNMALSTDADGSTINIPEVQFTPVGGSKRISGEDVRSILSYNKSCKAVSKEIPATYNYYMDDKVIYTTNVFKACRNPISMFESPVCLTPTLVDLIPSVCDADGVIVSQSEDMVKFESSVGVLYGKKCVPEDLEAFPSTGLNNVFAATTQNSIKLCREELLSLLDRMNLYVSTLESNKVLVTFESDKVVFVSPSTDSRESISYMKGSVLAGEAISMPLDALSLKEMVTACDREELNISVNSETGLRIQCGTEQSKMVDMLLCILVEG